MSPWLENLKKGGPAEPLALPVPSKPDVFAGLFATGVDDNDVRIAVKTSTPYDEPGDASGPDMVCDLIKNRHDALFKSSIADESWDALLVKTAPLPESTERRLQKARALLERVFGKNPDVYEDAVALFRQAVIDERAAILPTSAL